MNAPGAPDAPHTPEAPAATPRRSVVRALVLSLAGIVALVLALALGLLWVLRVTGQREARIRDDYYPRLVGAERVRAAMADQETGLRGFLLTGDETFLEPLTSGRADYVAARDTILARAPLSATSGTLRANQFDIAETWYTQIAQPQIAARRAGTLTPDEALADIEQGKLTFDAFRSANTAYTSDVGATIRAAKANIRAERRNAFIGVASGALLVIVATVALSIWLVRQVRRPLDELTAVVGAVEAGDTARRAPPIAAIEFDHLGRGVNLMLDSLAASARANEVERERLATIIDSASEGIIVVDAEGMIRAYNPAAAAMFGRPADEVVGQPASVLPFLADGVPAAVGASGRSEPVVRREGERVLSALVSRLAAEGADIAPGFVWVVRDVTELARIDEMKNEFVSIVSHELRTPLTAIKGFTDLILEGDVGEVTGEQREFLEIVQANSDRLVALINDMLDISRIESGRVALHPEPIPAADAIARVATTFRPLLDERQQTLQTEIDEDAPPVLADPARLHQILSNLVSNACKYTPTGGWITVRSLRAGGHVAISVSDTGVGIPPEALPRVFSKFYRVDQATTAEVGGTGLGLAITKALVEMHGGRITIASRPGAGTTVRFTLPTVGAEEDDGAADGPAEEPWAGARVGHSRVLLAEDHPETALLTQRQLSQRGLDVSVVPDGLAALVRAIEWLPDAIVLDVNMPKMGAGDVLPQLRGNPGTRDIPIVIVTGTVPDARSYFIEAGADDFFTKPLDYAALATRLAQLVRKSPRAGVESGED